MKCLFTYNYGKENMDKIRAFGYEIFIENENGITYKDYMKDIDILVCYNPFTVLDISRMKALKWIQLSSIGIDQLPVAIVKEKGITVTNNRGGYSIPMGEWVVLKILELYKKSFSLYKNQLNKKWKMDTSIMEIYGSTIGFIGTGTIAVESAKRLQGFGVKVIGMNTHGKAAEYFHKCYSSNEMAEMLSQCDVVVIAVPQTDETYHLINAEAISHMKDGVFLINIARGAILDEFELIKALNSGKIKGAALDVFEEEPLPEDSPLWDMNNVIITCHNSWISEMRNERRFETIYENMKRYMAGSRLLNILDINKGY